MAYTERRGRKKGDRFRGMYKDADGRYKLAGTYNTDERALQVAVAAEKRAAELIGGAVGGAVSGDASDAHHRGVRADLPAAPPGRGER
jgi:hypothetical protein